MTRFFSFILSLIILSACNNSKEKKVAVFEELVDSTEYSDYEDNSINTSNIVAIPFIVENGVKYVDVKINDAIGVNMIIDTGCSGAMISLSEARYLVEKGTLTVDDVVGESKSLVADGRLVDNMIVRLHKITIGDKLSAENVMATISSNIDAPLLLGNEVLDRVKTIAIDNENQAILFYLK